MDFAWLFYKGDLIETIKKRIQAVDGFYGEWVNNEFYIDLLSPNPNEHGEKSFYGHISLEEDNDLNVDFDPGELESISKSLGYSVESKNIYGFDFNHPTVIISCIQKLFPDFLAINFVKDKIYIVKDIKDFYAKYNNFDIIFEDFTEYIGVDLE